MPVEATQPGTEMNDTPEMLAPIIPKPTIHHGDCLPARKKASLSASRPENRETRHNTPNQTSRVEMRRMDIVDITPAKIRINWLSRHTENEKRWRSGHNRLHKFHDICSIIGVACDEIKTNILRLFFKPTETGAKRWQKRLGSSWYGEKTDGNKDNFYGNRGRKNSPYRRKEMKHKRRGLKWSLFFSLTSKITPQRVSAKDKSIA